MPKDRQSIQAAMAHPLPFIKYVDPAFTAERTRTCELRIQLSSEELVLVVYNPLADQFLLIEKYPVANSYNRVKPHEAIARILQTHALTRLPFKKVEVIPVTNSWTLIPADLYEESALRDMLALGSEIQLEDPVGADTLAGGSLKIAYSWPAVWKSIIENQFEDARVRHYAGVLAGLLLRSNNRETILHAHVHGFQVDLLGLFEGKPVLFNSYYFQSPEDFLYYVVLAYDQLGFNREMIPLQLMGEIEEGSAIYQICFKFIRTIQFMNRLGNSTVPEPEGEVAALADHGLVNILHPYDADY
ncbi:MAG: DUF3822 family protein [Bacteroidia bacterium]